MKKKVAVIGNGAIGAKIALDLVSTEEVEVTLFGDPHRRGGASKAAGAMINVFSEIECDHFEHEGLKTKFQMGYYSLKFWKKYIDDLESDTGFSIHTGSGCEIIRNEHTSPYEDESHKYLSRLSNNYNDDLICDSENIFIKTEFSIDARSYLRALDYLIQRSDNISFVDYFGSYIFNTAYDGGNCILLSNSVGENFGRFDDVVIAAGSFSNDIIRSDQFLFSKVQPIFYGIGSALGFFGVSVNTESLVEPRIVRTMNRGGACGFHLLKGNDYDYFGATNSISFIPEFKPRADSLAVLANGLSTQFGKGFGRSQCEPLVGFRPTSLDTFPLLGKIANYPIHFATGNKRDGLTSSIYISDLICYNIIGKVPQDIAFFSEINSQLFRPEREKISYFNKDIAIRKAAENRAAGALMHSGKIVSDVEWSNLVEVEIKNIQSIYEAVGYKIPEDFGVHPEMLNMVLYDRK